MMVQVTHEPRVVEDRVVTRSTGVARADGEEAVVRIHKSYGQDGCPALVVAVVLANGFVLGVEGRVGAITREDRSP